MSFYTGTQQELLFSWAGAGPALTASTSATSLNPTVATQPGPKIPAQLPGTPLFRAYRLTARGIATSSATSIPTFAVRPMTGTTDGALTTGLVAAAGSVGGAPAFTPSASLTGLPWELEMDLIFTAMGTSGTLVTGGVFSWTTSATAGVSMSIGGTATVAMNTTVDNFLTIQGTLSSVTAGNILQLAQLELQGMN